MKSSALTVLLLIALISASLAVPLRAWPQSTITNGSRSFGPDECGPADPAYIRSANETGGVPLFLQRSEAGKAFHLVRESTRNNVETVFWGTGEAGDVKSPIQIPVDSVSQRITFVFSTNTKGTKFALIEPSGAAIDQNSPNAEITDLNCGRIITVVAPNPGMWRLQLSGRGQFWAEAKAQSDIYFIKGEFVRVGGRPGHEGYFRIPGQPIAGLPATVEISLSATNAKTTEFLFVDQGGRTLKRLALRPENSDREFMDWIGNVELPSVPFRLAVTGLDSGGQRYQRFLSRLFHAEQVEVSGAPGDNEVSPGGTMEAVYKISNFGSPRTFKISATDVRQFVSSVEPKELTLGANQSGTVQITISVPANALPGTGDDIVIIATSTAGAATSNSNVAHLSVTTAPARTPVSH